MLKKPQASLGKMRANTFWHNSEGDVAALFGIMAITLFLAIGGAVDYGRWLHARNQTISAMDSAVLAAGRTLQVGGDTTAAVASAQSYYAQNVANRLPLKSDNITFQVAEDGMSVTATGNAAISTPFLSIVEINELDILDANGVDYSKSEIGVGSNAGVNLEISMMLDVTGSMDGDRIADLKVAAKDLIDIIVWDDQSEYQSRVALVPFSEGVRLPATAMAAARGNPPSDFWKNSRKFFRTDCMAERMGAEKYTDAAPGAGAFISTIYVNKSSGSCEPDSTAVISPLSSNKTALNTAIDALTTNGSTAGHLGTAWSWYTLSPNFNSLWTNSDNQAVAYGTPATQKIAILMTDGDFNTQYRQHQSDANGTLAHDAWSRRGSNDFSTNQARSLCTAMKTAGITVYTVGFGLSEGSTPATTMAQCATDSSKAFSAEDGEQLKQAFRAIALELSKLRLSS